MTTSVSLFLDFNLPNATTWFYFSLLLSIALFFKFSRLLSVRNWDVLTLFLLMPGLLLVQGSKSDLNAAALVLNESPLGAGPFAALGAVQPHYEQLLSEQQMRWYGYLWLMCGTGYFFVRCLLDLILVQRPMLTPNLTFGGLAWLAVALLGCLSAVAFRQQDHSTQVRFTQAQGVQPETVQIGPESATMALAKRWLRLPPWMVRGFAVVCHLTVVLALMMIGRRLFHDPTGGMAAATLYLILPYTGVLVGQVHHIWPVTLTLWALLAYSQPTLAGLILGIAAATAYVPALLFPLWLSFYWGRGAGRFAFAFLFAASLCLAALGYVLYLQGDLHSTIRETLAQTGWQPWKIPTTEGFWTGMHWAYRIPVFILFVAFVLATPFWPYPKNLAHVFALSTAILLGIQFWYAERGCLYVLWYLPLFLLVMFRPNLEERRAPPLNEQTDWLYRLRRKVFSGVRRLFRGPELTKSER